MPPKPSQPARQPDQPMLCPQCQAMVTKDTLNEHFVAVHGRKAALAGQATPPKGAPQAKKQGHTPQQKTGKNSHIGMDAAAGPDAVLELQIKKEIAEGILRCPDCGKKLKREKLSAHYQLAHQQRKGYKGKKSKEDPSSGLANSTQNLDDENKEPGTDLT